MTNKTNHVELTREELLLLDDWLYGCLYDFPEDKGYQSLYIKVSVALGGKQSEVEAELKEWEDRAKLDEQYEEELTKLHEKYHLKGKAA